MQVMLGVPLRARWDATLVLATRQKHLRSDHTANYMGPKTMFTIQRCSSKRGKICPCTHVHEIQCIIKSVSIKQ